MHRCCFRLIPLYMGIQVTEEEDRSVLLSAVQEQLPTDPSLGKVAIGSSQ